MYTLILGFLLKLSRICFLSFLFSSFIETAPKPEYEDDDENYLFDVVDNDIVEL